MSFAERDRSEDLVRSRRYHSFPIASRESRAARSAGELAGRAPQRSLPAGGAAREGSGVFRRPAGLCTRCEACGGRAPASARGRVARFWLPDPGRFDQVAIELDRVSGWFALLCFRRHRHEQLKIVNALPNRYRLRELEATLLELRLELPSTLLRYFVAVLGWDAVALATLERQARRLLCCTEASAAATL